MGELVWAAIGFAAAAFAAEYFLPTSGLPYLAAALVVLSLAGLLMKKGSRRKIALLLTLSAAAGALFWWGRYERCIAPCEELYGQDITVTAQVTDYPDAGDSYTGIPVRILDGAPRVRGYIYLYADDAERQEALAPGDIITARVRVLSALNNSAGQRRHTHTAYGRSFLARALGTAEVTGRSERAWIYFPQRLARAVKEQCAVLFPADAAPFVQALLTGDKDELYEDTALYSAMRASGVLHIVAVSGMHIVILVSFLRLLLGRGKRASLVCIPVMLVFVFMAGCGASVVRAAVMETVLLLAPVFEREYDGPASLSAALLGILAVDPMAIGGVGLQLSFSCALGFTVLYPRLDGWCYDHLPMKHRLVRMSAQSIICTVCATVFSLPIAAYYFGVIPLLSGLANLLTLYVIEICFAGCYVVCAVGAIFAPAGAALAWVLAWGVRYCVFVYDRIAALPFACLYTLSGGAVMWLIGTYVVLFVWRLLRKRRVRIWFLLPAELCVIGALAVLLTGGVSLTGGAEITALDVGQGECILLLDETAAVVVDCGGSGHMNAGDRAADALLSRGKTRVDMLVLTHLHEDHTNGVVSLMMRLPVGWLVLPADHDDEDGMLDAILSAAEENGTTVLLLDEETEARVGEIELTLLLPSAAGDENDRGIVALARLADETVLMMGDAGTSGETALLQRGAVPDVDVLVVGHHGSKTASGTLFLRTAQAETAVISVGSTNPYGHPADETITRLEAAGSEILRTDEDGNITIRFRKADGNADG